MDPAGSRRASAATVAALRRRAADFVAAGALLRPGERVLLMLSGGADSMALLDLVGAVDRRLGLGLALSALHVDYATRGSASARDRRIVTDACRTLGVPLHVVRLARKPEGAAFQERARTLRYEAAREIVARGEADVAVTAHNRDDQAETVLYRLVKYAAPSSLRAMRPREDGLARPLLCLGAAELRTYCRELGIVYGDDETNAATDYRRNLLRHEVLPVLETINPRVAETLADAAALADDEHAVLAEAVDGAWERVARPFAGAPGDGPWALDLIALAGEPPALRALCLRRLVRGVLGSDALIGRRLTQRLTELAAGTAGSRGVSLSAGHEALREYRLLTVRARAGTHACPPAPLLPGSSTVFCGRRFGAELLVGPSFAAAPAEAWLAVPGPGCEVVLRHPRRGDRLRPFGMASEVLLSDFFTGARVPRARRPGAVVAEVDGRLAWVCPGRSSEWFRVGPGTPYTLHIFPESTEAT
ncbi:MAG TPA: tRNA lysidine(34) synthetase TilS [Thermoleophilia bacterium]|nr:tRNA lysidine(34) synthetase TilS [Thermoleophilia bacterium]